MESGTGKGPLPLHREAGGQDAAPRRLRGWGRALPIALGVWLLACVLFAAGLGSVEISPAQVVSILLEKIGLRGWAAYDDVQAAVLEAIRLPRVVLAALVGAGLASSDAALQGLYRNPLADPGLLGISSGAALGVSGSIVLGVSALGMFTLPLAAFLGSLSAMVLIYSLARHDRKTNVAVMLLAGIAINALCGAGTGLFSYFSTEDQLRSITFWLLGSLGGATWPAVLSAAPFILLSVGALPFFAGALNALLLGEANARHLGVSVETVKTLLVLLIALGVGAGVAVSGMIGFVGLVVPHLVRLVTGPNHRLVLPNAALLGASLLVLADLLARTLVAPLELPLGIVTSALGAPFFLFLLLRKKRTGEL